MNTITALIGTYGLWTVFAAALIDASGLPVPSYPVLMAAAALAINLHGSIAEILITGIAGALTADTLWYRSGKRFGNRIIRQMCRISLSPDSCIRNTNALFTRTGPKALSFIKFVPGLSNIAVALAGAGGVSFATFLFFDMIGASLYIGVGVGLGVIFHNAIADVLNVLTELGEGGLFLIVAALGLFILRKWFQRHRFIRQLRMDRISVDELRGMIDQGQTPILLDVRTPDLRRKQGVIPGSIFANRDELDKLANDFPPDSEIIIYCSCPGEASAAIAARHLMGLKKAGYKKIRPLRGGIEAWIEAGHPTELFTDVAEPLAAAA